MAPEELLGRGYGRGYYGYYWDTREAGDTTSGMEWLRRLRERYSHSIWLNPSPRPEWGGGYWGQTYDMIAGEVPMFPLSVEGLEDGMKKLLVK